MKKLLLVLSLGLAVLTGCNDKGANTPPPLITDPVLPPVTEEFSPGETVTITGSGFTASDEIWLRMPTKADGDIQATIVKQTPTEITFTVPQGLPEGECTLVLKRGGTEMVLGKVAIGESVPATAARLYGLGDHGVYEIDRQTYALTPILGDADFDFSSSNVYDASKNTIYSIEWYEEYENIPDPESKLSSGIVVKSWLGTLNLNTNTFNRVPLKDDIDYFACLIDGSLHLLAVPLTDDDHIRLYSVDPATGTQTEVIDFGSWATAFGVSSDTYDIAVYSTPCLVSGRLLMAFSLYGADSHENRFAAFDLNAKTMLPGNTIPFGSNDTEGNVCFFERQGETYTAVVSQNGTSIDSPFNTHFLTFDPENLAAGETVYTLDNAGCFDPQYDPATDRIYWADYWEQSGTEASGDYTTGTDLYTFDFATRKAEKSFTWDEMIWTLVLAR